MKQLDLDVLAEMKYYRTFTKCECMILDLLIDSFDNRIEGTITELEEMCGFTDGYIRRTIRKLEEKGLAIKETDGSMTSGYIITGIRLNPDYVENLRKNAKEYV